MSTMPIDIELLNQYTNAAIKKGVKYGFGAKDPHLAAWPIDYSRIDCSGFVRAAIAYATRKETIIADGSWMQDEWLTKHQFERVPFADCGLMDNVVRCCVHLPSKLVPIGHIWLVVNGKSYESHGGVGVDHREWNHSVLSRIVTHTFKLT